MAKQKTSTANTAKLVEDTVTGSVEAVATSIQEEPVAVAEENSVVATIVEEQKDEPVKELRLTSTKNVPLYKIASKQRNMVVGTIVAGHSYPYKGKAHTREGVFYNMGKGFVFAEECVKIQ